LLFLGDYATFVGGVDRGDEGGSSLRALLWSVAAAVALLVLVPAQSMAAATQWRINNGTVELGVRAEGNLNVYSIDANNQPSFDDYAGLRYLPAGINGGGNDATANKACEGWGVAEAATASSGYSNLCDNPPSGGPDYAPVNVAVESFTTTTTTAISTVLIRDGDGTAPGASPLFRVTHNYHPSSATSNLYEVTVKIENVSSHTVTPLYRRVVDWNIEPDTFAEALTMTGSAPYVFRMSNDGYSSANPLADPVGGCGDPPGACVDPYREKEIVGIETFKVDPTDQGSLFDLSLPSLVPGASVEFPLFFGAAGSLDLAKSARDAVDADSHAVATPQDQPTTGTPNTFVLAFNLDRVTVTNPPVTLPPPTTTTTPPSTSSPTPVRRTRTPPAPRAKPLRFQVLKHRFRRKVLEVTLVCTQDCDVTAKGKLRRIGSTKSLKLKKAKRKLRANVNSKIKLRLTKSAKRSLRRSRAKKGTLAARLSLTVVDGQGKRLTRKPAFQL
jgi:hypothetical protein